MRLWFLLFLLGCSGSIYTPNTTYRKFAPEAEVEQATRKALARWVAATGISLEISNKGMPIFMQDYVYVDNEPVCGSTDFVGQEIVLSASKDRCNYWSFESLLLHEIGHAITMADAHSDTGIMAAGGKAINRECIDRNSLEHVCSGTDCEVFEPECD